MTEWTDGEDGPWCKHCDCITPADVICDEDHGWPTVVRITPPGVPVLMCFGHTPEAGLMLPLPMERPENWELYSMRDVARMLGYLKEEEA